MIAPTLADIGRRVIYRSPAGFGRKVEKGELIRFNQYWAFVRYGVGCTSSATDFADLEWLDEPAPPGPDSKEQV